MANAPHGSVFFCESGNDAILPGKSINGLAYKCDLGDRNWRWGVRDLISLGWTLTNQTRTPVDTYQGTGYEVSLQFVKK